MQLASGAWIVCPMCWPPAAHGDVAHHTYTHSGRKQQELTSCVPRPLPRRHLAAQVYSAATGALVSALVDQPDLGQPNVLLVGAGGHALAAAYAPGWVAGSTWLAVHPSLDVQAALRAPQRRVVLRTHVTAWGCHKHAMHVRQSPVALVPWHGGSVGAWRPECWRGSRSGRTPDPRAALHPGPSAASPLPFVRTHCRLPPDVMTHHT